MLKSLATSATVQREEIECSKLQAAVAHESYLHPTKVMGLDISATDLAYAIQGTAPRPQSTDSLSVSSIRWEPFEVEIWQGGLQSINPEFVDVECIVSTEVYVRSHVYFFSEYTNTLFSALNICRRTFYRISHQSC